MTPKRRPSLESLSRRPASAPVTASLFAATLGAASLWLGSLGAESARAIGPTPASILESTLARQILSQTRAGENLVSQLAGGQAALRLSQAERVETALRRLHSRALSAERAELEQAIREAETRLTRFRAERPARGAGDRARIAAEEAAFLELEAARLLRVSTEWRLPSVDPVVGEIEFVDAARPVNSSRTRFLDPEPLEPALRRDLTIKPRTALTRARDFVNRLDDCMKNRPPEAARAQELRFMLQGIGISELFTVGGYIAGSGEKEVDWANLPTDVLMTALWGALNTKVLTSAPTLRMRWVRVVFMGQARSATDAVFYYVTPLKDTHGRDPYDATLDRWGYNATWNAAMSPVPVALYTLLTGLECVHGTQIAKTAFGIRMATSAATSFAYFRLRNEFVGENSNR